MIITLKNENFGCSDSLAIPDDADDEAIEGAVKALSFILFTSVAIKLEDRFNREADRQEAEAAAAVAARRSQLRLVRDVA